MKQYVPLGSVGIALCDQPFHDVDDLRNMLGDARLQIRRENTKRGYISMVGIYVPLSNRRDRLASFLRSSVDLVIDIREVADLDDVFEALLQ